MSDARSEGRVAQTVRPRRRISLIARLVPLFVLIGLVPTALATYLMAEVNRSAVEQSERQLQAAVLSEVANVALQRVQMIQDDARAVAAALSFAATRPPEEKDALSGVRSLLLTRRGIDAVRFEVPDAQISTVLRRDDAPTVGIPRSTPDLRLAADKRGIVFATRDDGSGLVVAPVTGAGEDSPRGYVVVVADLRPLQTELDTIVTTRFEGGNVSLLVADSERRSVAAHGFEGGKPGSNVADLAIWRMLPEGTPWTSRVGVVSRHVENGVPMVGGVETVADLGWAVAIWRSEAVAYQALTRMRRQSIYVGIGALVLALVVGYFTARAVSKPILRIAAQVRLIGQRRWRELTLSTKRTDELGDLERSIRQMAGDLESGEDEIERLAKLRGDLSRFMSPELVDAIVRGKHPLELGGQRAEVTVLFADVVAFTPLAESHSAEEVVAQLNDLFSMLSEVVFRHHGLVDKFIGDCVMAVWGAIAEQSDHAERALAAADDMMRFLETANEEWREKYGVELRLGIGINSGSAIAGNIGSNKRMEYTVIGDVVNVASRLEAIAKPNQVLLAESTQKLVGDAFATKLLGEWNLTGRKGKTRVYELETDAG